MIQIIIYILLLINNIKLPNNINNNYIFIGQEIKIFKNDYQIKIKDEKKKEIKKDEMVLATYQGNITGYGPDCKGCSGTTASGYKVNNGNIYFNDKEYGKIRIVAADKSLPFGSIIKISNLKNSNDIMAIVLDRGGAIGFKKKVYFDLLHKSEKETNNFGIQKATFTLLRKGY